MRHIARAGNPLKSHRGVEKISHAKAQSAAAFLRVRCGVGAGFAALPLRLCVLILFRAELLGDFFHQLAELPGRVEVSDGHVLKDLFAGEFLHVGSIDIA